MSAELRSHPGLIISRVRATIKPLLSTDLRGGLTSFKGAAQNPKKPIRETRFASALNVNSTNRLRTFKIKKKKKKNMDRHYSCSLLQITEHFCVKSLCSVLQVKPGNL